MATQAEIGARIRQARERIKLSQEEFAAAVGKDQRAISEYENGKRKIPAVELSRFADVLIVPISYFFDEQLPLDSFEQIIIYELRKLPNIEDRQAIIQVVRIHVESILRHMSRS